MFPRRSPDPKPIAEAALCFLPALRVSYTEATHSNVWKLLVTLLSPAQLPQRLMIFLRRESSVKLR
jgi:hypothetical protein